MSIEYDEGYKQGLADALAQQKQEPVAWYCKEGLKRGVSLWQENPEWRPLYTTPPRREWTHLTWEEIDECFKITPDQYLSAHIYKRIFNKLKEKNGFLHTKKYVNQIECQRCGRMIV